MTLRARPSGNRSRTWDERDRRSFLLNIGFGLTVVVAILLLGVAFGAKWYSDHLSPAATVNGESISKDAYQTQLKINSFRIGYQQARLRTLLTAQRIRTSDYENRISVLDQRTQQANVIALEQLIDGRILQQLAPGEGVTVSDADVDAQVTKEATTPELRHAWMIAIEPTLAAGETTATDAEKAVAKAAADKALADLKAGKDWDTIAKSVSTDTSKDQAGDLGFLDKNAGLEQPFVDALFQAPANTPTSVILGEDGIYRIGRVTEIAPPVVDSTLETQVTSAGVSMADFRAALSLEVLRTKLNDAVVARILAPGPQRHVEEIYLAADIDPSTGSPTGKEALAGAVKIRHILYSPNGDAQAAASLAPDDAAWTAAQDKANATYQKLLADPSLFPEIAKSESNDAGSASRGGKYWFTKDDGLLQPFADAIFKAGLTPGQLLAPVKTEAGWHVIQILHFAPDTDWAAKLKAEADAGTDFAKLARDNSDSADASKGGDMGWVAKGQLQQALEDAIFATKVGGISEPVSIDGDGVYLFKVTEEQTKAPDADQKAAIESSAFSTWYQQKKADFTITRDPSISSATTG